MGDDTGQGGDGVFHVLPVRGVVTPGGELVGVSFRAGSSRMDGDDGDRPVAQLVAQDVGQAV